MPEPLIHRVVVHRIRGQVTVLGNCSLRCSTSRIPAVIGIPFQQALAFQKPAGAPSEGVRQLHEFGARRRLHPAELG